MSQPAEHPRSNQEMDAREELMREQFLRDEQTWEEATPLSTVLAKLKARLSPKK
jgi:hypothetical protein